MKLRAVIRMTIWLAIMALAALAADVSGKWKSTITTPNGQTRESLMNLKAEGDKLTGTISGRGGDTPITDGKVSGDSISFAVVRNFGGNEMKMIYKGKVAGNEINFTVEAGERRFEMTAKRAE